MIALTLLNSLAHVLCQVSSMSSFVCRNELMQRRIEETDGDRASFQSLVHALRSRPAASGSACSRAASLALNGIGADHLADSCDSVGLEEHMLGTAEADTLSAKRHCLLGVIGGVSALVRTLQLTVLVSPVHDARRSSPPTEASTSRDDRRRRCYRWNRRWRCNRLRDRPCRRE